MYPVTSNVLHLFLLKHRRSIRFLLLQCGGSLPVSQQILKTGVHSFISQASAKLVYFTFKPSVETRRVDESECNIGAEQVSSPDARPEISEQK